MKKFFTFFVFSFLILILFNCKSLIKESNNGNFRIVNSSDKVIEFVWLAPEGIFYPVARSINITKGQVYEVEGLEAGLYDIAIDFQGEFNSFNSKKDKSLCLRIEKGITKVWIIDNSGSIIRN
ncbi:MAG: hypothetical protein JXB50_05905 [Spirochaetes bacterium]|nr:hypothetical protein [Spirochaetota bacterium]